MVNITYIQLTWPCQQRGDETALLCRDILYSLTSNGFSSQVSSRVSLWSETPGSALRETSGLHSTRVVVKPSCDRSNPSCCGQDPHHLEGLTWPPRCGPSSGIGWTGRGALLWGPPDRSRCPRLGRQVPGGVKEKMVQGRRRSETRQGSNKTRRRAECNYRYARVALWSQDYQSTLEILSR